MTNRFKIASATGLALALCTATAGFAEEAKPASVTPGSSFTASYDFFVGGFRIAEVDIDAEVNDKGYSATSRMATRGVLEVLLKGRVASQVAGERAAFGQLRPKGFATRYRVRTGEQTVQMGFKDATPVKVILNPPEQAEPYHAKPAEQRGSLDPLSAAVAALLPADSTDLCNRTIPIFDGKRRFDIIFLAPEGERFDSEAPQPEWNRPLTRCLGIYERVSGFEAEAIKAERYFPFDIWFEDSGNGVFRAVRLSGRTKLGYAIGNLRQK